MKKTYRASNIIVNKDDLVRYLEGDSTLRLSLLTPNGLSVIKNSTFKDMSNIESIVLNDSVVSIEDSAFENCSNLKTINLGVNTKSIGKYILENCDNIETLYTPFLGEKPTEAEYGFLSYFFGSYYYSSNDIYTPTSLKNVYFLDTGSNLNLQTSAFYECLTLEKVKFSRVDGIPNTCFKGCASLKEIDFGPNCSYIGKNSFESCTSLTSIYIPGTVKNIGQRAFYYSSSLKEAVFGNGVEIIQNKAFYGCALEEIVFPASLKEIGTSAFSGMDSLTSIVLNKGITKISNWAFENCTNLSSIIYKGTTSEWENVTKYSDWADNCATSYVQCSDGQVHVNS